MMYAIYASLRPRNRSSTYYQPAPTKTPLGILGVDNWNWLKNHFFSRVHHGNESYRGASLWKVERMHFEELLNSRVDLCYLYSLLSRFGKIAMYIPISLLFPPPLTNAIDKINGYSGSTAGSMLLCGTSLAAGGLSRMQSCLFCRLAFLE